MFTAGIAGNETSSDNENSLELDPFVGLAGAIGNTGFGYDVGYVQFTFPGAPGDFDFAELYLNLSYSIEDLTATDRKSTRLNSSHVRISYAVFCLKKKKKKH